MALLALAIRQGIALLAAVLVAVVVVALVLHLQVLVGPARMLVPVSAAPVRVAPAALVAVPLVAVAAVAQRLVLSAVATLAAPRRDASPSVRSVKNTSSRMRRSLAACRSPRAMAKRSASAKALPWLTWQKRSTSTPLHW